MDRIFFVPTKRNSVLPWFNWRKFGAKQDLTSDRQARRHGGENRIWFADQIQLNITGLTEGMNVEFAEKKYPSVRVQIMKRRGPRRKPSSDRDRRWNVFNQTDWEHLVGYGSRYRKCSLQYQCVWLVVLLCVLCRWCFLLGFGFL